MLAAKTFDMAKVNRPSFIFLHGALLYVWQTFQGGCAISPRRLPDPGQQLHHQAGGEYDMADRGKGFGYKKVWSAPGTPSHKYR